MNNVKNFFRTEWAKFREMTFAEKRWYIWEYYKLHIFAFCLVVFLVGSFIHARLTRMDDYFYIAWIGVPATHVQLSGMAEYLSVIVDDPQRQRVTITDYSESEDVQFNVAIQTRFLGLLHVGTFDAFIICGTGLDEILFEQWVQPADAVLEVMHERHSFPLFRGRLVIRELLDGSQRYAAISLAGAPFIEQFGIDSSNMYLAVVANTERFEAIAKALEVILYGT